MPKKFDQITLAELRHLLDVYHGRKQYDLESPVPVKRARVKGNLLAESKSSNAIALQVDSISEPINSLESFILNCELAGFKEDQIILGKRRDLLIEIIRPYLHGKMTPENLLCKRIATYLQVAVNPSFAYDALTSSLILLIVTFIFRSSFTEEDDYPSIAFKVLLQVCYCLAGARIGQFLNKKRGEAYVLTMKTPGSSGDMLLQTLTQQFQSLCNEYSEKLGLINSPQLYVENSHWVSGSSFTQSIPEAPGGYISISKAFLTHFDTEEIRSALAHEMGHFYNQKENYSEIAAVEGANAACVVVSLSSKFLFQFLNYLCSNTKNIFGMQHEALFMLLSISLLAKKLQHDHEFKADQTAAKLTGKLSVASTFRTANYQTSKHHFFTPLLKLTEAIGINDVFASHPSDGSRIKALMKAR